MLLSFKNLQARAIVVMFFTVCVTQLLVGQPLNWDQNNKYWSYRNRLVNNFLVRGTEFNSCDQASGLSIPAKLAFTYESEIRWADATAQLGWYIAVLATEYRLEALSGFPSQNTLHELYYAMLAYERLDRKTERLYYPQNTNADCSEDYLNGLFARDDVDYTSFQNNTEFRSKYSGKGFFDVTSDYIGTQSGSLKNNVYPSADQITDLFMGFALVVKCVGDVSYQGYNFRDHATFYADKIASRLSDHLWVGVLENLELYENGETFLLETTAYGIAKAAQAITGSVYSSSPMLGPAQVGGWQEYGDFITGPLRLNIYYDHKKDFSTALIQGIGAIGSSWEYGLIKTEKVINIPYPSVCLRWGVVAYPCIEYLPVTMYSYQTNFPFDLTGVPLGWFPFPLPDLNINVTSEMLAKYGVDYNQQIFSLLHEYLYEETSSIPDYVFKSMVDSAPCAGPRHMPSNNPGDLGVDGWRATNRFNRSLNADGWIDHDNVYSSGEFNGLDYMLLHNLYALTRGGLIEPFKNRLNQVSSETLTSAGNHWSYESLEFNGTVQANASTAAAPVEISSGKSVTLKPGFHTQPGSRARVFTANYTACNTIQQQSSSLRTDESKVEQVKVDTALVNESIHKSIARKITNATNIAVMNDQDKNAYTPLSVYLENRAEEINEQTESLNGIILYPNPVNDRLQVVINVDREQQVRIELRDVNGKQMKTLFNGKCSAGETEMSFNTADLPEGTFLLEMRGELFSDYKRFVRAK